MNGTAELELLDPHEMDLRFFGAPLDILDDAEDYDDLHNALARLDPKQCYILIQTVALDQSQVDMAQELGVKRQAIHQSLKATLRKLREVFNDIKTERSLRHIRIQVMPPKQEEREEREVRVVRGRRVVRVVRRRLSTLHETTMATNVYNAYAKGLHFLTGTRLTWSINVLNFFPPAKRTKAMKKALKGLLKEKETRTQ